MNENQNISRKVNFYTINSCQRKVTWFKKKKRKNKKKEEGREEGRKEEGHFSLNALSKNAFLLPWPWAISDDLATQTISRICRLAMSQSQCLERWQEMKWEWVLIAAGY